MAACGRQCYGWCWTLWSGDDCLPCQRACLARGRTDRYAPLCGGMTSLALQAMVMALMTERDAVTSQLDAVTAERDTLLERNERLHHRC